jgi:hypothetical protein
MKYTFRVSKCYRLLGWVSNAKTSAHRFHKLLNVCKEDNISYKKSYFKQVLNM